MNRPYAVRARGSPSGLGLGSIEFNFTLPSLSQSNEIIKNAFVGLYGNVNVSNCNILISCRLKSEIGFLRKRSIYLMTNKFFTLIFI